MDSELFLDFIKVYITRVAFYILELKNKNKYYLLFVFQKIFPIKISTLLHAFEPIVLWLTDW